MNIYIKGYSRNNLGDDLFFKILLERYDDDFLLCCSRKNKYLKEYKNLKLIYVRPYQILSKLFHIKMDYEKFFEKKSDAVVEIGGSLFIQKKDAKNINFIRPDNPYYILGSNIGPFYEKEYLNKLKKQLFLEAKDVCLRDLKSYHLCKEMKNVRYATDIVFSLNFNYKIAEKNSVVISVINCKDKNLAEFEDEYEKKICEMIEFFNSLNYEVILMSFCKAEKDEYTINSILSRIKKDYKNIVKKYFYDGNINEALRVIASCKIVVGSRFHANIIGLLFNKVVIPIAYSDKTVNILKDMNFEGKIFDIRKMNLFDIKSLSDADLNYKLDISYQKKDSENQFLMLDKFLKRKGKNE